MVIEDILKNRGGEGRNVRISVNFNKLIRVKEYESERVQAEYEFDVAADEDPMFEAMKAQAALEYEVMTMLLFKKQITQEEYNTRKAELEQAMTAYQSKVNNLRAKDGLPPIE